MPRNGSGVYTLPAGNPVVTGTTISSTVQNNTMSDVASELTNSIAADGQKVPTANLPMGGFRHTGVSNATARDQYASAGQVQDGALQWLSTVGGTADVITASTIPAFTAYTTGQSFTLIAGGTNTTNVTININGLGAKAVTKNGATPLAAGDIVSGGVYKIVYDGTQFVLASNASTLAGFRNLLVNGNFLINQRAYVSGAATTGANQYTLDRWRVVTLGQSLVFAASGNGNQITAPAGGVEQVIEAANIIGGTYTLNWTGTATATVNGVACLKGGNVTLPANTNATVRLIGGTASKVQLEPGTMANSFEQRPVSTEYQLCRWYFQSVLAAGIAASSNFALAAGNTLYCTYSLPVPMRATPTSSSTAVWSTQNVPSPTIATTFDKILLSATSTIAGNCFFTGASGQISLSAEL